MTDDLQPALVAGSPPACLRKQRLTTPEAVEYLLLAHDYPVKPGTLEKWRWSGDGPEFEKLRRGVFYHRSAIDAWISGARQTKRSTSDAA